MKSTNYYNTFVSTCEDCKKSEGTVPPTRTPPTVAYLTYALIIANPYRYTSDEVLFEIHQQRSAQSEMKDFNPEKQACFRCSSLAQTYGWGFHFDIDGRVAIYRIDSIAYQQFLDDGDVTQKPAFSSKR